MFPEASLRTWMPAIHAGMTEDADGVETRRMMTKSRQVNFMLGAFVFLISLLGCTPYQMPYVFLQYGQEFRQLDLVRVVADSPLKPGENIRFTTIGQGQGASHHVVQIRDREPPHLHKAHDGTVIVTRGRGYLVMEKRRITLSAGDIVHIPRGVPHYYVNTDLEPTVAVVIFAPPFDGKDNIPATMP